jgi:transcriptional regulator
LYIPKHYEETNLAVLHGLIAAHPLGAWVTTDSAGLAVDHIPFHVDAGRGEFGTLVGHVAKANPVWRSLSGENESAVIFRGVDAYVSPSWYPSKQEHGNIVPTWNYAVVHAFGKARAIHDHAWLLALLERLTAQHESGRAEPWRVGDLPANNLARRLDAIVGIELPIRRIEGKWKASQKEAPCDRLGIAAGLRQEANAEAMARLVEVRAPEASDA